MSQQTRQANRERGSATIEAVIGVPAFVLFVLLIIAAWIRYRRRKGTAAVVEDPADLILAT